MFGLPMPTETLDPVPPSQAPAAEPERLAYSLHEAADLLGVDYFSVYRLIQRGKLRVSRAPWQAISSAHRIAAVAQKLKRVPTIR